MDRRTHGVDFLIRELSPLLVVAHAHGDMVMAAEEAELANGTLMQLGQAIRDGASAVREIVSQIDVQRLGQAAQSRTGVREEPALYYARCAGRARPHPVALMIPGPTPAKLQQASHALH